MNHINATDMIAESQKVYIIRLQSGAMIAAQVSTLVINDDEEMILDNPSFVSFGSDGRVVMDPFVPVGLVKTTRGVISPDSILMMWEASASFTMYYINTIIKFAYDLQAVRNVAVEPPSVVNDTGPKKSSKKKKAPEANNVVSFSKYEEYRNNKMVDNLPEDITDIDEDEPA